MSLTLLSWRRSVFALYSEVRAERDPERAWERWRTGRDALFAEHPDSPLLPADKESFKGLPFGPYDPALRWELPVEETTPERRHVPTMSDGIVPFERIGVVRLPNLGTLDVWWLDSYGGGIFVPVADPGPETYGGGRYLIDTVKGADLGGSGGSLVIDLNFAYNPSCAYNDAWTCPLAGPTNMLEVPISAGEHVPKSSAAD
jgi:uncharacterized protein (DUF1684 family)